MNTRDVGWAAAGAAALGVLLRGHIGLMAGLRRRPALAARAFDPPSVTVIRPIRGLDVEARQNVRALLALDYPGEWEALFVFDSEEDPAFAVTREELANAPTRARRVELLVAGEPPEGLTGKLNAMQVGVACSRCTLPTITLSSKDHEPTCTRLGPRGADAPGGLLRRHEGNHPGFWRSNECTEVGGAHLALCGERRSGAQAQSVARHLPR